ncbi:MAG: flagellar biosynthesis protein FlgD [Clostridia bacterium]|nr:flagellar biosynthesis protein FlgD [Clostridia bacterium]
MGVNEINNQKTIQQIIDSTSTSSKGRNTGALGKDDFLNLLITQLKYQDPLKPVEDKEFIGQMAQFSSLEQMQNMNSSLSQSQAFTLIGKNITANIADANTSELKAITGEVTSVKVNKGKIYVVVKGEDVPVDRITNVTEGGKSEQASKIHEYTNLIGFDVKGCVYDPETANVIPVNGVVKELSKGQYEDYAVMDGVEVNIADFEPAIPSADIAFRKSYLENNKGKTVSVVITNEQSGQKVPVSAVLRDYSITAEGKITATLDQLNVPVDSIIKIVPAK